MSFPGLEPASPDDMSGFKKKQKHYCLLQILGLHVQSGKRVTICIISTITNDKVVPGVFLEFDLISRLQESVSLQQSPKVSFTTELPPHILSSSDITPKSPEISQAMVGTYPESDSSSKHGV